MSQGTRREKLDGPRDLAQLDIIYHVPPFIRGRGLDGMGVYIYIHIYIHIYSHLLKNSVPFFILIGPVPGMTAACGRPRPRSSHPNARRLDARAETSPKSNKPFEPGKGSQGNPARPIRDYYPGDPNSQK